jgi:hypothetical protein
MTPIAKSFGLAALGIAFLGAASLWAVRGPAIVTDLWAAICL